MEHPHRTGLQQRSDSFKTNTHRKFLLRGLDMSAARASGRIRAASNSNVSRVAFKVQCDFLKYHLHLMSEATTSSQGPVSLFLSLLSDDELLLYQIWTADLADL